MNAEASVQEDNHRVRITQWRLPPGARTGHHRHEHDYVVVPLSSGQLRLEAPEGVQRAALQGGEAYYREAGVEHDVQNVGSDEIVFVEVELKRAPG